MSTPYTRRDGKVIVLKPSTGPTKSTHIHVNIDRLAQFIEALKAQHLSREDREFWRRWIKANARSSGLMKLECWTVYRFG